MTKGEAKEQMLRWLDEATINGTPASDTQLADYLDRANYLLDGVVKFLAGHFHIPAVHSVVRQPMKNLLGSGFGAAAVYPDKPFVVTASGAQSFYIEVQGSCVVTVGDRTFMAESAKFEPIKGNISSAGDVVTLRVTADYPAVVRNCALYAYPFADDEAVPDYTPFVPYDMPEDFREFDRCIFSENGRGVREYADIHREGHRTYLLPYDACGQFDFHYWRNPATIPPDAPDDTPLEVEERAAQLVPLKLAVDLTVGVEDMVGISQYLDNKFNYMTANILTEDKGGKQGIEAVYSIW